MIAGGSERRGERAFRFVRGPIFANMLLADEINRTPPKTQAALLEAMQEQQVTAGGQHAYAAGAVLCAGDAEPDRAGGDVSAAGGAAGPVHVHGDGGLSDARTEERAIVTGDDGGRGRELQPVLIGGGRSWRLQEMVRKVPVADHVCAIMR